MREERGSWYLLTGLLIGIALGLIYSWWIAPAEYINTVPATLRDDFKDSYRAVIASSYAATGDLERAKARLFLLKDADSAEVLAAQAQRYLAGGGDPTESQALALLAASLGQAPVLVTVSPIPSDTPLFSATPSPTFTLTPTVTSTPTPISSPTISVTIVLTPTQGPSPTPSRTPRATGTATATATPLPTRTSTPTLAPPFVLDNQVLVCNPELTEPQIQIFVGNAAGRGVPSVEIQIVWDGGSESFFTGLKPEIDLGYADYTMTPNILYSLQVEDAGEPIRDLSAPECEDDSGGRYWGSWRLVFNHP
jgi:hypothetical protein